jgi:hypothetical protein
MNLPSTASGVYVYCIAEGEPLRTQAELHPSRPVYCIPHQDLFAVASPVSLEQFDREALLSRLADARWLESEVRAHEAVIEKVMQSRTVLPLKFCTVFRTEARVRALLSAHQVEFRRALARLRGKEEWEVKLFVRPRPAGSPAAGPERALSGKEYLLRQAAAALKASEALHTAHGEAQRTCETLAGCAEDVQLKPIAAGSPLSRAGLICDAVCLLARSRVSAFWQQLETLERDLRDRGLHLQTSGPWPPYHFTYWCAGAHLPGAAQSAAQMGQDDVTSPDST